MICKDCPYKKEYRRNFNSTKGVMCVHPDKEYIRKYFKDRNIKKYQGFIGFINSKGIFPVKKSPMWCPLKQKGSGE